MSVSLSNGQQVSLAKADGGPLTLVRMGLGWQAAPPRGFLYRPTALVDGDDWQMAAIGELADRRTFQDLMPAIASHL
jgi:tellurium resistance protein TerZ